jgi:hypothetical protein
MVFKREVRGREVNEQRYANQLHKIMNTSSRGCSSISVHLLKAMADRLFAVRELAVGLDKAATGSIR